MYFTSCLKYSILVCGQNNVKIHAINCRMYTIFLAREVLGKLIKLSSKLQLKCSNNDNTIYIDKEANAMETLFTITHRIGDIVAFLKPIKFFQKYNIDYF